MKNIVLTSILQHTIALAVGDVHSLHNSLAAPAPSIWERTPGRMTAGRGGILGRETSWVGGAAAGLTAVVTTATSSVAAARVAQGLAATAWGGREPRVVSMASLGGGRATAGA